MGGRAKWLLTVTTWITMVCIEVKGYRQAYRELICFFLAGVAIAITLYMGVSEISERGSLFEPFTVGVVDLDGTPELIFVFDFFNEYVIDLKLMEADEAMHLLSGGEIPAFIELPANFTRDVFHGINSPFTVHLDGRFPLQGNLVHLLATGGIAYLSASQAGVYAALDYAFDAGMTWDDIQRDLLIPVNMAFAQELIRHDDMFMRVEVPLVAGSITNYFLTRFAVFWHMLCLIALVKFLPWYPPGILARFKLAGISPWKIKGLSLFIVVFLISVPIMPLIGIRGAVFSSIFVTAFGLLSGKLFVTTGSRALFIFFIALGMYFASGGIVPYVFLPPDLLPMRWFSINYWVAAL